MNSIIDNAAAGVAVLVLVTVIVFAPTLVGHLRGIVAFRSVSALNALTLLLAACFLVPDWLFFRTSSPLVLWVAVAVWATATVWSLAGRRRDD